MPRLIRSRVARQDLIDIWSFVAGDSESAADRLLDRIDAACLSLVDNPWRGAARDDMRAGLRHFVVGAYLVLYRIEGDEVQIIRIVHGRRDLPRLV